MINRRSFLSLFPSAVLAKASPVYSIDAAPDGSVAAGLFREVRIGTGTVLTGHVDAVRAVAFSPDGKRLAAGGGQPGRKGEWKLWDLAAKQALFTSNGHSDAIYSVAFSPGGNTIATSSYDKLIKIWDAASGKEIRTLKDHIDAIYAVAFTPDGSRLVSGAADRSVKIWNPETGERLYTLSDATDGINTIALDPKGRRVAAGGIDKTIRIWTMGDTAGELQQTLIAHEDAILRLAWSPDGKTLASASADRTIKRFNPDTMAEVAEPVRVSDWPQALKFAPNGTLIAGLFNGEIKEVPK